MTNAGTPPGWYRDPTGLGEARYWNGTSWTEEISLAGRTSSVPIDPVQAQRPPVPGTQFSAPHTTTVYEVEPQPSRSPVVAIFGILVALVIVVVIFAIVASTDSDDAPTPDTGIPATEAPAEDAPEPPATDAPTEGG